MFRSGSRDEFSSGYFSEFRTSFLWGVLLCTFSMSCSWKGTGTELLTSPIPASNFNSGEIGGEYCTRYSGVLHGVIFISTLNRIIKYKQDK